MKEDDERDATIDRRRIGGSVKFSKGGVILIGAIILGFFLKAWEDSQRWADLKHVSGAAGLEKALQSHVPEGCSPVEELHCEEARLALERLGAIDFAARTLFAASAKVAHDPATRRTRCDIVTPECRIPSGTGVRLYGPHQPPGTPTRFVRHEDSLTMTLATIPSTADILTRGPDYVVLVETDQVSAGSYTNLASASRIVWQVFIVDRRTGVVTAETTLIGSDPPAVTQNSYGDIGGPPQAELASWIRQLGSNSVAERQTISLK